MAQLVKFEIENTVDPLTGNYNRSDLKRVDSDIANIFKGAKSSISKSDFISMSFMYLYEFSIAECTAVYVAGILAFAYETTSISVDNRVVPVLF